MAIVGASSDFRMSALPTEAATDIDLSPCLTLERLEIKVLPGLAADAKAPSVLRAMLNSWTADVPSQVIRTLSYSEDSFTRREYADCLRAIGPVLEEWLDGTAEPSSTSTGVTEHDNRWQVVVFIYDWESWEDWWCERVEEGFPMFARSGKLRMDYTMRK